MKRRHLQELLGDEQEPFILQTFLDEKRSLLLLHRELHRVPQPTTTNPHGSKTTTPLLREAAERIHGHRLQNNGKKGAMTMIRWRRWRRKRRRRKESTRQNITLPLRLVVFSLLKKLLPRKLHRGIGNSDENDEDESSRVSVKDVLSFRWEYSSIEDCGEQEEERQVEESISVQFSNSSEPQCGLESPAFPNTHRIMPEIIPSAIGDGGEGREIEKQYDRAEEEKDQFSPVSVMDPPFVEDHLRSNHHPEVEGVDVVVELEATQGMQTSVEVEIRTAVQRCRKQLFRDAKRSNVLDGLEPLDLEKERAQREDDEDLGPPQLMSDLIAEDLGVRSAVAEVGCVEEEVKRRMKEWREMEENTIDMMVELDLSRESGDGWRRSEEEEVWGVARGIELRILWVLMEEAVDELHCHEWERCD